ncbi:MAG: Ig-like domain-containing protein [bacterium]|nr:Ig-like domain-containing protein [bacterium]
MAEQKELVEDKDIDDEEDNEEISNYQLVNLIVGQTSKLQYDFLANTLSEVKFTSQNSSIASVDDEGKITGISPGTTTITLEYTGGKLEFYITVNDSY